LQRESVCNQEDKMMAMQTLYSAKRIETLKEKLDQLSDEHWIVAVWQNFMDCLNENIG